MGGNATVGVPFTWTLTVTNSGTIDGIFADTQTILQDTLPAGPAYGDPTAGNFTSITNSANISCSIVDDILTCAAGGADVTIGAGGGFTVTFSATPAAPGVLDNTATVDPDNTIVESDELNNTGSDSVSAVSPAPDLTVAKTNDTGGNAAVGTPFTWILTVANGGTIDGTFADTQTILQDTLPTGPAYGDPTAGNFTSITNSANISCSIVDDILTCAAGGADVTIGAGGSFMVTFTATPAAPGVFNNTATVDPDNNIVESNELNNTGSDSVSAVSPAPDLTVAKTNDTGGNAAVGTPFTWILTVANGGTIDGTFADTQTILQDSLPIGPAYSEPVTGDFVGITNSANISCSIVDDVLSCTAGGADVTIGAGGSFIVTVSATPAATGVLENAATVDPDDHVVELNELNNTGSDTVSVSLPDAPPNDDFNDAISVSPLPYVSTLSTIGAGTHEHDPAFSCIISEPLEGRKSVWYSYTVTHYEAITIDTDGSNYDTIVGIWVGTFSELTEVACSEQSSLTVSLVPGQTYYIEVAQSGGDSGGSLHFSVTSAELVGLRGDYFNNIDLLGTPVLTRVDPLVNFNWTANLPGPGVPSDNYSVRWTGRVLPQYSEVYTFYTYSDDGVRLWVDDQLLIDEWGSHEATEHTGAIALQSGTYYSIRLEYYQYSLASVISLQWSSDSVSKEIVPTEALDYLDVANSTVLGDGAQPVADGTATSAITITLTDSMGNRVSGVPVYLKTSGSGNYVNNSAMEPNVWILIGYSNGEGQAVGLLASTSVGAKTIKAMAGGMSIGSDVIVTFVAGQVERISISHISGQEGAEADSGSNYPSVSNDGTQVVFLSAATNLLPNDNTSNANIYILNTGTNVLSQAMFATENGQPDDLIGDPKISGNGQFVVFTSIAHNLSTVCVDGVSDIYVYEITEGAPGVFTCISIGIGNVEADAPSMHPSISDDGRYVVFASTASNLVSGVSDHTMRIYLYDRITLTMSLVSVNSAEELADGDSDNPSISADGLSIVFESIATNLVGAGNDTNIASDIFLRDISGDGETTRISVTSAGEELTGSSTLPSISSDGGRVVFLSDAGNLTPKEPGVRDVYLRDIPNTSTSLISVDISGGGANGSSNFARISSDGLRVIFASTATDLVPGVNSGIEQIYLRDLVASETVKISHSADGDEGDNSSSAAAISSDGSTIVFQSNAGNLVAGDTLGYSDIFLTERVAPAVAPENDDLSWAISILPLPFNTSESTYLATRDLGDDPLLSCGGSPSQHYNSVWFTIQPSVNTRLDLSTAGSSYDTVMAVWSGTPGNLTEVACDDDSASLQSTINFLAAGGTRYWIEVVQKGVIGGGSLVFNAQEVVPPPVYVYVFDFHETPDVGLTVMAFDNETETGYSVVTNEDGEAMFELPEGSYRFRVVKNGETYWSGETNHCVVPGCPDVEIMTTGPMLVTVEDTEHTPEAGMEVKVFDSNGDTGYSGFTNSSGQVEFTLPSGVNYHFRVIKNLSAFWSNPTPNCSIPTCIAATITTNIPITITVLNGSGLPEANIWVHAFDGNIFTGLSFKTDAAGQVHFTLPDGSYRFRADKLDRVYWSGADDHCTIPNCADFTINVFNTVVVHVHDSNDNNDVGIPVRAFGDTSEYFAYTDANGNATLQVPNDEYRFRAMKGGTPFWSGETPTCSVPTCSSDEIITNVSVIITVRNSSGVPEANLWVHAFNESGFAGLSFKTDAAGQVRFTLPDGSYRFRADKLDRVYWSGAGYHCTIPAGCADFTINVYNTVVVHVRDTNFNNEAGIPVRAFGDTSEYFAYTDSNGNATLQLPDDDYRFRAAKGGSVFWSGATPTCTVPACSSDEIITNAPVTITVLNGSGQPEANLLVHAFHDSVFTGLSLRTDSNGQVRFTLSDGSYRFRVDKLDRVYWSGAGNHCIVPAGCADFTINVYNTVVVHVHDTNNGNDVGIPVRAFGATSEYFAYTDSNGNATLQLPNDNYRFRAMKGGTAFWSGSTPSCTVPACSSGSITTNVPVIVTIRNGFNLPEPNIRVYAFSNDLYTGLSSQTNAQGVVSFTLPDGNYRFRADKLDRVYWSGTTNHCKVPGECTDVNFSVFQTVVVHVHDTNFIDQVGIPVRAFGDTSEYFAYTDANGNATLQVPNDEYRFRAMIGSTAFWSGETSTCSVPTCSNDAITTNAPVTVTVRNASGEPEGNLLVHAFNESFFTGLSFRTDSNGQVRLVLPDGSYRFRADKLDHVYWSGTGNHCNIPTGCADFTIYVYNTVVVHVRDTNFNNESGIPIRAFGDTSEFLAYTDSNGNATLQLPDDDYRFRAMKGGVAFWSGATPTCTVPACSNDEIVTNAPVTITVLNGSGQPEANLLVHAFHDSVFTGLSLRTDSNGQVRFTLSDGSYRFRVDKLDRVYWSGAGNHCIVPAGCADFTINVYNTVVVHVHDTNNGNDVGIPVRAFGATSEYFAYTDSNGNATLQLPNDNYRFRAMKGGTAFWSDSTPSCSVPSCSGDEIITNVPVTVTVRTASGEPEAGLYVHAFNGSIYAGLSFRTDTNGQARFTLPDGRYHFGADKGSTGYWSALINDCTVPGCTSAEITTATTLVTLTVQDSSHLPLTGMTVAVFTPMLASSATPLNVSGMTSNAADLSVGYDQTCAITLAGGVKCWGQNLYGQLGNGNLLTQYTPVDVVGLTTGVESISAGRYHTCAVTEAGGVKCWGNNEAGQLGDGTYQNSSVPVDVIGLSSGVRAVAASHIQQGGYSHTCALMDAGGVKCWGNNETGQLGNGTLINSQTPVDVVGLTGVVDAISAGSAYTCALNGNEGVQCWGHNVSGQLGDGFMEDRSAPVDVVGLTAGVQSIAAGEFHACAVLSNGAKCWGENDSGQLGNGTTTRSLIPVNVSGLGSGIARIAAGDANTCVIMGSGGVKCWGFNSQGQVYPAEPWIRPAPVDRPEFSSGVSRIAIGGTAICVVAGGGAQCWGMNGSHQLGYGPIYQGLSAVTNPLGQVQFTLPPGEFTFRVVIDGQDTHASCTTPSCTTVTLEN